MKLQLSRVLRTHDFHPNKNMAKLMCEEKKHNVRSEAQVEASATSGNTWKAFPVCARTLRTGHADTRPYTLSHPLSLLLMTEIIQMADSVTFNTRVRRNV